MSYPYCTCVCDAFLVLVQPLMYLYAHVRVVHPTQEIVLYIVALCITFQHEGRKSGYLPLQEELTRGCGTVRSKFPGRGLYHCIDRYPAVRFGSLSYIKLAMLMQHVKGCLSSWSQRRALAEQLHCSYRIESWRYARTPNVCSQKSGASLIDLWGQVFTQGQLTSY